MRDSIVLPSAMHLSCKIKETYGTRHGSERDQIQRLLEESTKNVEGTKDEDQADSEESQEHVQNGPRPLAFQHIPFLPCAHPNVKRREDTVNNKTTVAASMLIIAMAMGREVLVVQLTVLHLLSGEDLLCRLTWPSSIRLLMVVGVPLGHLGDVDVDGDWAWPLTDDQIIRASLEAYLGYVVALSAFRSGN
ncbi:unnamed protein product [Microthlaspi erraticum]|uniref:Uncharacterized protein n=1 Tax=Microthlaspi erraticum TaxID=1685480 RepID=A0A6D2I1B7_9BRAS|nr:unnamed protein product [Microthlaspi erraticum]